jgi:hypothetical protein
MNRENEKVRVKKELEKIYDKRSASREKWNQAGQILRKDFGDALKENPKLNMILKFAVVANVGIWLGLVLQFFKII